ncbi:MAG: hypothetical protein JSS08_11860 [Proteobacteria bacterium]|nr:hypothetical protein [Pseudomonadota bacterium]
MAAATQRPAAAPVTIDDYLARLADPRQQAALAGLRALIRSLLPDALEWTCHGLVPLRVLV